MTNRILPNAKTVLTVALAASALLGLSACNSNSAKPSAAATATSTAPAVSAPTAPSTNQSQQSPATPDPSQPAAATVTVTATETQAQPKTTAKPVSKPTSKPSTGNTAPASSLPGDCTTTQLKATVTGLTNPINHVLLTVTNTGSATCSLYYYPDLRFDADQQAVTPPVEDSKPQAVVSIAPGDSAYASIGTSASDGSGTNGKIEPQVQVFLEARDQSGSLPGSLTLPLPANTYVDSKAFVTYWQSDLQSATTW